MQNPTHARIRARTNIADDFRASIAYASPTAARSPDLTTERARWKGPCADAARAPVVAFAATTWLQRTFVITLVFGGIDRIHRGVFRIAARQRPFTRDQPRRNSDLRFANGLDVAPAVGASRVPVVPASCSIWR